jgi:hypothetical protein
MDQLECNPLAMSARRKPPPFDNSDLVWRIGVRGVMGTVHTRRGDDLAGLNSSAISCLVVYLGNRPFLAVFHSLGLQPRIQFNFNADSICEVAADSRSKPPGRTPMLYPADTGEVDPIGMIEGTSALDDFGEKG